MDLFAPTEPLPQGGTSAVLGVLAGTSAGLVLRPDTVAVDEPAWRAQLDDTASLVQRWTDTPLACVKFDTATFTRITTNSDPLIGELRTGWSRHSPGPHRPGNRCEVRVSQRDSCGPTDARDRVEYAREQLTPAEIGHPWPTAAEHLAARPRGASGCHGAGPQEAWPGVTGRGGRAGRAGPLSLR